MATAPKLNVKQQVKVRLIAAYSAGLDLRSTIDLLQQLGFVLPGHPMGYASWSEVLGQLETHVADALESMQVSVKATGDRSEVRTGPAKSH